MCRQVAIVVLCFGGMLSIIPPGNVRAQTTESETVEFLAPPADPAVVFEGEAAFLGMTSPQPRLQTFNANEWSWSVLPEGLMYKSYVAGEREPRLSSTFLSEVHGQTLWDSALGGRAGLVRFGNQSGTNPEGFQLDVEGAAFVRLMVDEERDVNAVDFRAGVPLTYREGPFQAKIGYYHISSHLGDEFLIKNPGFDRLNYVRDAVVAGVGYFPHPWIRTYFEVGWAVIFTSGGAKPWEVQTGFEVDSRRPTGLRGEPYFAMNIHLREEVNWGGSLNVLAGWQWRGHKSDHVFRVGLQFYNGKNAQYSLLQDNQQLVGLGIRYDF